jgi:hypothetical protein
MQMYPAVEEEYWLLVVALKSQQVLVEPPRVPQAYTAVFQEVREMGIVEY